MKKENLLARGIEKIGMAAAENAANKKLIIMLHEPEVPEFVQKYMEKKEQ